MIEQNGPEFNLEKFLKAREETIKLVEELSRLIKVGDDESTIVNLIREKFQTMGVGQFWHPIKIRVGKNTCKSFSEKSEEGIKLQENDIYFLDIGPVIEGHEADFGRTFVLGKSEQYKKIADASEKIFHSTKEIWKTKNLSGIQLYEFAQNDAKKLGYTLNLKMDGHRIGDFPHAIHFKGGVGEIEVVPKPYLWVLEILLLSEDAEYGAFFEDILF